MLSVVCWKWKPPAGYRSKFDADTVNILRAMVKRHYAKPHRFICVTDNAAGISDDVEIVPAWNDFANVPSPHGFGYPSCYRRLRAFAPDIASVFGERFVSLDLDTVIVNNVAPLWDRCEDFIGYRDPYYRNQINGSMFELAAGTYPEVWNGFIPRTSPLKAMQAGYTGSDQAWISYMVHPTPHCLWDQSDGVYSYRFDVERKGGHLPHDARIVFFHGATDPWSNRAQRLQWVQDNYRL